MIELQIYKIISDFSDAEHFFLTIINNQLTHF